MRRRKTYLTGNPYTSRFNPGPSQYGSTGQGHHKPVASIQVRGVPSDKPGVAGERKEVRSIWDAE